MNPRIIERSVDWIKVFAPAKCNLFLAITGQRPDGYHELSTIVGKLSIGDTLEIHKTPDHSKINLNCPSYKDLENEKNLVFQAVQKWHQKTGENWGANILLNKEIPPMSGLGGGSSDAVSALVALNELGRKKLSIKELIDLAGEIGSDCPSFFQDGLCLAQGRGENIHPLNQKVAQNLIGQKVLLFRPEIGFSTAEVYRKFTEIKKYSSKEWINKWLQDWQNNQLAEDAFLFNDLENAVFLKHRYFSVLFHQIKTKFGLNSLMSGSGSCCFTLIPKNFDQIEDLKNEILSAWGDGTWVKPAEIIN